MSVTECAIPRHCHAFPIVAISCSRLRVVRGSAGVEPDVAARGDGDPEGPGGVPNAGAPGIGCDASGEVWAAVGEPRGPKGAAPPEAIAAPLLLTALAVRFGAVHCAEIARERLVADSRLIGAPVLMATVKGLQAAQIAKARRAHARRRWRRLQACVPLLGRISLFVQQLHAEVSFRPGGQGAKRCRDEFEALVGGGALHELEVRVDGQAAGEEKHRRPTPAAQPAALRPPAGTPCDEERSISPCFVGVVL